jgi:hypothetical protein
MRHLLLFAFALIAGAASAQTPAERADLEIDDIRTYRLLSDKPALVGRITGIFRQLERTAGVEGRFRVLVTNAPAYASAESHANGVIVITESFAAFPDADIAFVLAHELAHESLDHPRLQALLSDQLRGDESPSSFQMRVVFGLLPLEVTTRLRHDESTADALACRWALEAGYRFEADGFFARLGKQPSASPEGSPSHPSYAQRIADLKAPGCAR